MTAMTVSLNDPQTDLLLIAYDNGGVIYPDCGSPADRKAADALSRCGLLTPRGRGWPAENRRRLTPHDRDTITQIIRGRAGAIIARHIDGPRRLECAANAADDLRHAGYLLGGDRAGRPDILREVASLLACRYEPATARRIAQDLHTAWLLAGQHLPEDS